MTKFALATAVCIMNDTQRYLVVTETYLNRIF